MVNYLESKGFIKLKTLDGIKIKLPKSLSITDIQIKNKRSNPNTLYCLNLGNNGYTELYLTKKSADKIISLYYGC
jgi:hypothetical protein